MSHYYVKVRGKKQGPFTMAEVFRMLGNGTITRDTDYMLPGWLGWIKVGELMDSLQAIAEPTRKELSGARDNRKGAQTDLNQTSLRGQREQKALRPEA